MASDLLARARAGRSTVPEALADAQRVQHALALAARSAPHQPPLSLQEPAAAERAASEHRVAETQGRLDVTPWWRRRERQRLNEQLTQQERALEHWQHQEATATADQDQAAPADAMHATGPERLQVQSSDRAAVMELLAEPPVRVNLEAPAFDTGLEL